MIPLCVRSGYSLGWGLPSPRALARAAAHIGYRALALTDTDNLYGLWDFLRACRRYDLRPLVGAEITEPAGGRRAVCLVKDAQGFGNLCRLITARHQDPAFGLGQALEARGRGLVLLTDDPGLLEGWHEAGLDAVALIPRRMAGDTFGLRRLARRRGLAMAAVPDSFFLAPVDHRLHRVLRAIALNTSLARLTPSQVAPAEAWLARPDQYARRFVALPQALAATHELAERAAFIPRPETIMPPWRDHRGLGADAVLREQAYQGAARRYGQPLPAAVVQRLEHELGVIAGKHFSSYFLVVKDIVGRSPRICGRGSGAASLVAYCLGITNVCPIKFNLYFERFINPQRSDPPDIDVDFAWDERDAVLQSVLDQHQGRAAMVATHVLFRGRMAIRETAKVFGLPAAEIKRFMKGLPWLRGPAECDTGMYPKRQALPPGAPLDFPAPWPEILRLAQGLVGVPRHISVHVGGVVITPGPISGHVPIETAPKGVPVIQWEKDGAEEAGLVKIDLLGNRSLGVIRDAVAELKGNGHAWREAAWEPEEDPATQRLVAAGDTMGCFYIESPATRLLQQKAAAGDYEHLVIHSSIIRPAANDYIQEYLRRLHGGPWQPIHPLLADILAETYGIMVYQEQVSQAAVALAGFSHAEGDGLRKVMSKKDKEHELADFRRKFVAGARGRGVSPKVIDEVWQMMLSFSGYSFCKPHSASYARVSFQAAYLKAHFPAEFMAAVISNQGGFYSTFAYVSEARRLGLAVLPPDVNRSQVRWSGAGRELRVGLMAVAGLGRSTARGMVEQRADGPYQGFEDLLARVRPDEAEARALIHAGACDRLPGAGAPEEMLWHLARRCRRAEAAAGLFSPPPPDPPPMPPASARQRLRRQYAVLGFLIDRHPMALFVAALAGRRIVKAASLQRHVGRRVRMAGWLITGKTVTTSQREPMQFLTFEDETGLVEATFFPQAYRRFYLMLDWQRPYLLEGLVEENFGAATLTVSRAQPLPPG